MTAQLKERWKESSRLSKREKPMEFSDTTWLIGGDKEDEMYMRRGSFMYKGEFKRSMFVLADRKYMVVKRDAGEIQIKDEEGVVRVYQPDKRDNSAADAVAKMAEQQLPPQPASAINIQQIAGSWEAYKRMRKPGVESKRINYDKLIKSVFILEQPDASGNKGFLYNSSGVKKVNTDSYIAIITTIDAPQMLAKDRDGKESKLTVWRADDEELILEDEDGMLYYCKKF